MAQLNTKNLHANFYGKALTHEGAVAKKISKLEELKRSVLACLLWEDTFYESGESIADRIKKLVHELPSFQTAQVARDARNQFKLRHVPLLIARELARHPDANQRQVVADLLEEIVQRPDELAEYLAIYWKDGKQPLSAQTKKGLAAAFNKFSEYALAKYNRDGAIKLRDVLFLSHAKPKNKEQEALFNKLISNELATPDTWEVALSAGADKKETFTRLIAEKKLGALALLRNLRNMEQAGVNRDVIKGALAEADISKVLPFRFITASRYAPSLEPELEKLMFKALNGIEKLKGKTALLIDVSGSMQDHLSIKSELSRVDAASALAILLREICEDVDVIAFDTTPHLIPARRGFALRDAINQKVGGGTNTETAKKFADERGYDRIIIITDEQSHETLSNPKGKGYVVNVASYQNGVGYGKWNHVDGFSESIVTYIQEAEKD